MRLERRTLFVLLYALISMLVVAGRGRVSAQESPIYRLWRPGDWWTVKLTQKAVWMRVGDPEWVAAGRWKFTVREVGARSVDVEVADLDRPQTAKKWRLRLRYDRQDGKLVGLEYAVGSRSFPMQRALLYLPLRKEGLLIGHSLDRLRSAPKEKRLDVRTREEKEFSKIDMAEGQAVQLWDPADPWWRFYERQQPLPLKAEMTDASWWRR